MKLEAKDENYEIIRKNSVDPGASLTSNGSLGSSSSANGHGSGSLAAITPMSLLLTTRDGNTAAGSSSLNLLGNEPSSGLARIQSMFSMKNKSLRLQKWGSWIAYEDYQTHRLYWYNHETSKGQWEMPDQVLQMQQKMIAGQVDASTKVRTWWLILYSFSMLLFLSITLPILLLVLFLLLQSIFMFRFTGFGI